MRYRSEFKIAHYTNKDNANVGITFLGVTALSVNKTYLCDFSRFESKLNISKSITMDSYACGGAFYPSHDSVYDAFLAENEHFIISFLATLDKKVIFIFHDGDRCSSSMTNILIDLGKRLNITTILLTVCPYRYEGRKSRKIFDEHAEAARKSTTYVLELNMENKISDKPMGLSETLSLKHSSIFNIVDSMYYNLNADNINMDILKTIMLNSDMTNILREK